MLKVHKSTVCDACVTNYDKIQRNLSFNALFVFTSRVWSVLMCSRPEIEPEVHVSSR